MTTVNNLLTLADYSDPILRTKTKLVEFPLSDEVKQIISDMKYSIQPKQLKEANAPWDAAVGMAANQWGIDLSIFLYCPDGDTVNGLSVIINPSYEIISPVPSLIATEDSCWEGCFSVPLASGHMKRSIKIRAKYKNQKGESYTMELSDWPARVWQHENDHLNGILYDDPTTGRCLEKKEFATIAEVEKFYQSLDR
jgi:peptide deformylase